VDKHGLKSEATARAGYAFIEGNFNETEWWPVIHGAHARYSAKKPKKAIIFGVRNDVERVIGHRPIWSVVRPYVDAIAIPLALSSIGAESDDHAVGSGVFQLATSHIGSLFPSAAAFTSFFLRGAVQLVSGALFPVIFAFSLAFYVYTLLTSNSRVLDRIVRALHPGTTAQHEALTKSIQNLVYRSMYLPVCYSCAMGTTTLMVLYLFSWIAPVSYISIAVLFVFIVTLFPVLGIPGYILVTLPWVLGAAVNGGFSFIVSIAMLIVVPLSLWFTQQQFFKHTVHDENALNLLAMLMGLYVFGLWGVIAGPFLAGAVLLLFQVFTPTRHVHARSDEKESMA
jgi:predicted PurR-regulated permease PerM